MNRKNLTIIAASGAVIFSLALLFNKTSSFSTFVSASECNHQGNHYAAIEPTDNTSGNKEFWVCCKCHGVFLEKPLTGKFEDQPASAMTGGLDENHIAYLSPLKGGEQGDYYIVDPFE